MRNYYQILNVKSTSSADEIKKAYRKLAKEKHPDRSTSPNAHKEFIEINNAYQILSVENLRKEYDNLLLNNFEIKEEEFAEKFDTKNATKTSEEYSSMKYEDFESILEKIANVGQKVKKGAEMGCGFILMIVSGLLTLIGIFNIGNSELPALGIFLIIVFGLLTLLGWAMSRKDF